MARVFAQPDNTQSLELQTAADVLIAVLLAYHLLNVRLVIRQ
jgi:hypothetical protein